MNRGPYNLNSPNSIRKPCDLSDLDAWVRNELHVLNDPTLKRVIKLVLESQGSLVQWPERACLLWDGCDRIKEPGQKLKHHQYPLEIRRLGRPTELKLDTRPNGPAIAAFQFAGGNRPKRFGTQNAWNIHHLYSGKFEYINRNDTLHAVKDGKHFTQSAGLLAAHPVADALFDEYPFFAWYFPALSFQKFGYDPDNVFQDGTVNQYGFSDWIVPEVFYFEDSRASLKNDLSGIEKSETNPRIVVGDNWKSRLTIVNCGKTVSELKAGSYVCPNKQSAYSHRRTRFLGAYTGNKTVSLVAEIHGKVSVSPDFSNPSVDWSNSGEADEALIARAREIVGRGELAFTHPQDLKEVDLQFLLIGDLYDTDFVKTSRGPLRGSRIYLHNIVPELNATSAQELANLLTDRTWEELKKIV